MKINLLSKAEIKAVRIILGFTPSLRVKVLRKGQCFNQQYDGWQYPVRAFAEFLQSNSSLWWRDGIVPKPAPTTEEEEEEFERCLRHATWQVVMGVTK